MAQAPRLSPRSPLGFPPLRIHTALVVAVLTSTEWLSRHQGLEENGFAFPAALRKRNGLEQPGGEPVGYSGTTMSGIKGLPKQNARR